MYRPTTSRTFSMKAGSDESLKVSAPMGPQTEGVPDPDDRTLGQPHGLGHAAGAPVGGMPTCCLRGGCLTGPNHSGVELHGFQLPGALQCGRASLQDFWLQRQAGPG